MVQRQAGSDLPPRGTALSAEVEDRSFPGCGVSRIFAAHHKLPEII